MSQDAIVMAFRARLASNGYTEISICRLPRVSSQQLYRVIALEPLARVQIVCDMDFFQMNSWRV